MPHAVYMLLADGDIDQTCATKAEAQQEKRDLEKMGFEVKVRTFTGETMAEAWEKANAYEDKKKGY